MTDFEKATITVDGDNIAFGVPFSKVDVKNRTVEGFATLDNIDKSDEIVDADASVEAFDSWIGNVREMHHPSAVGKAVQIETREMTVDDGKSYRGVWVKTKISKGAEDAWEKIKDGTYSGYSIGGKVLERRPEIVKSDGDDRYAKRHVSRITKYHLGELSVVDNPMNQLALFDAIGKGDFHNSLIKSDDGSLSPGELIVEQKGLFYCEPCDIGKTTTLDTAECATCENSMVKIGEVAEAPEVEDFRKMVDSHMQKNAIRNETRVEYEYSDASGDVRSDSYVETAASTDAAEMYAYADENENDSKLGSLGKPVVNVSITYDNSPNAHLTSGPEGSPQTAKADEAEVALSAQKAEGQETTYLQAGEYVIPREKLEQIGKDVLESLKSGTKSTGNDKKRLWKQDEDVKFVNSLLHFEKNMFKAEDAAVLKAAIVIYNQPGQRASFEYSMSDWNVLGKSLAERATAVFESEHTFSKGYLVGSVIDETKEAAEIIINLQKNDVDGNNDVVSVLQRLFSTLSKGESDTKGGETNTLDPKDFVTKVLEVLTTATREIEETAKAWNVQALNNEDASGSAVGGGQTGGVGAEGASGSLSADDVTVADETGLNATDGGPEKVTPNAIPVDATGADPGTTVDAGPDKVLPHADLPATAPVPTAKAEGAEETAVEEAEEDAFTKATETIVNKLEEFSTRLNSLENSGGVKKSADVDSADELKKSSDSVWGGAFYSGELN